ncbi:MAG: sigma-70 family RNA polymerase sigma factor [Candidatus Pseudobacter hemicellulosilyticus]|uniref:Sigma-70 family RNA polymerase sigma factor n=1 Tax=Candidatus Pseudobacter hemicellulosilyticus TaxID=3121375 RepID=A0AAJ5WME9_9BACT|nr:MAG: sigma-70 family RNA polymerase sigma factor [Pseudobacter sp.]
MAFLKDIQQNGQSDQELVTQFRQSRDLGVLAILFQRYMELLYGVCLKYLKEPETARDTVMQLFEELAHKLPQHEVEHFKGWLYTLARNYCLMQLRTPRNLKTTEFKPEYMQSEDESHLNSSWQKETDLQRLESCLRTLSGDQRTAVELFYLQNKCYKEISETTGIDWNKVRSHIQNGRRNLKLCMEKHQTINIES